MDLAHFRISIHELLNKNPDMLKEEAPLVILDCKSAFCMANNGNNNKHTRHIAIRVYFVRNGENSKCKRLTSVKEVYNWQTLQL